MPDLSPETVLAVSAVVLAGLLLVAVLAFGWWDASAEPARDRAVRLEDADR